ncbi:hypothetical protein L0F63_000106, partial [Massospora cicadina]
APCNSTFRSNMASCSHIPTALSSNLPRIFCILLASSTSTPSSGILTLASRVKLMWWSQLPFSWCSIIPYFLGLRGWR